mgnify:CR=1 FL=1
MILTTSHYWANWDCATLLLQSHIGIVTDRRDIIMKVLNISSRSDKRTFCVVLSITTIHPNTIFAQWQESGRDQGHTLMCVGLVGVICQLAWSQGDDFFAYDDNLFLAGDVSMLHVATIQRRPCLSLLIYGKNTISGMVFLRKNRQL